MKYKKLFNLSFLFLAIFIYLTIHYIQYRGDILSNQISARVAKDISSTQNLYQIGCGGRMPEKIEKLMLTFEGNKEIGINEARKLIVYGVSKFIDEVNSNKSIRSYLANYPFTAKNIELVICLYKDLNYTYVSKNHVFFIESNGGLIKYYPGDSIESLDNAPILVETYEEALAALGSEAIQVKKTIPPS